MSYLPTEVIERRVAARRLYEQRAADIKESRKWSAEERHRQLAKLWLDLRADLDAIHQDHLDRLAAERSQLEDKYFNIKPTEYVGQSVAAQESLRNAVAAADSIPVEEVDQLTRSMQRAIQTKDTLAAKAVLRVAFERRQVDPINAYIEAHPASDPELNRLWSLTNPLDLEGHWAAIEMYGDLPNAPLGDLTNQRYREIAGQNSEVGSG